MPSWTLSEIMSAATRRAGRRSDLPGSLVSELANTAIQIVSDAERHASMESVFRASVSSGATIMNLPAGCADLISLTASTASSTATLRRLRPEDADLIRQQPSGPPQNYLLFGDHVEFFPSLNSDYSIIVRFYGYPSDLTLPNAIPSLHTPWRYAVMLKTEQLVREEVSDHAGAALAERRYQSYVDSLRNAEARRQYVYPVGMTIRWK